jgi:hypothetical protein
MRLKRSLLAGIAGVVLAGLPSTYAEACPNRIQTRHLGPHVYPREQILVAEQHDDNDNDNAVWLNLAGLVVLAGLLGYRRDCGIAPA